MNMKYPILRICLLFVLIMINIFAANVGQDIHASSIEDNSIAEGNYLQEDNQMYLPIIFNRPAYPPVLKIWTDLSRYDVMVDIGLQYEATHSVDVVVESKENLLDAFLTAAPAGAGPDILIFPHDRIAQLYGEGLLYPINLSEIESDFTLPSLKSVWMGENYYGLPYATENLALFYNKDLVTTPPTSWEALHTLGQALQTSEDVTWGFVFSGTTYDVYPIMTANDGYVFGEYPDGSYNTDDLGIDSPGMIAFGEIADDWVAEGFLLNDTDWNNAHTLFETGEVPWIMAGPWVLDRIKSSGINYGIADFPSGFPFSGIQGFVINTYSIQPSLAQSFLTEFVATSAVMLQLYLDGNRPPVYIPVLSSITDPDMIAFGEIGLNAEPMPGIPEMACVWGPWGDALTEIMQNIKTPTEAYTDAEIRIRECIDNPLYGMVNIPGSYQTEVGCAYDWDPACAITALTEGSGGLYSGTFTIPAGEWECKVALDGSWTINYGAGGVQNGPNIPFAVATEGNVTFTYDPVTHLLNIEVP